MSVATSVTAAGRGAYGSGGTCYGDHPPCSDAVTEGRTGGYVPGPRPVTCVKCGKDIPPTENMLLQPGPVNAPPEPTCMPCMKELVERCRPYYCYHVPWEGSGVRHLGRTRHDYQHWCGRCGRAFLGALARKYCSDECGELTRAARRDRRQTPAGGYRSTCASCDQPFTPKRSDARFCSGACRQFAYRQRKAMA